MGRVTVFRGIHADLVPGKKNAVSRHHRRRRRLSDLLLKLFGLEDLMKRSLLILVGVMTLSVGGWSEDAKPAQDLSAYLDQLQTKLDHTAQRANQPSSNGSNVVGLRGSKQEPLSKQLYWKGKTGETVVTPDEVKMFRTAIEQAQAGQKDQAVSTLKSFEDKYPQSGLKGDADDTLKMLASSASSTPKA